MSRKPPINQLSKSDRPLRAVAAGVLFGFLILTAGLWYVQIMSAHRYKDRLDVQSLRTVRLPPVRGKILDRNGVALAENRPSLNVHLYLEELRPLFTERYHQLKRVHTNELWQTERRLRLNGEEVAQLEKQARYSVASNLTFRISATLGHPLVLKENAFHDHYYTRRYAPLPVMKDLSREQVAKFAEQTLPFPAAELEVQPLRHYPHDSLAAHVLGHVRKTERPEDEDVEFNYPLPDFEGVMGLELAFDAALRGRGGKKTILVNHDAYREEERIWPEPEPGKNLVLALDAVVQQSAEAALASLGEGAKGAIVAMDVRNGDLLALASAPSFDPNLFVPFISHEDWARVSDPELTPLYNRASKGEYPPGSTFKLLVGAATMEAGVLDPDAIYHSLGYYRFNDRTRMIKDEAGPGPYNFESAFARSSNPYFIEYGLRLGPEPLVQLGRRFQIGAKTGIEIGERSGYFPALENLRKKSGSRWLPGDTANLCIGQGEVTVTPLQMTVATAAVANGGKVWRPRLVTAIEPQTAIYGDVRETRPPQLLRQVSLQPDTLRVLHEAMLADVEKPYGTGKAAKIAGFPIGGKTGTAQLARYKDGRRYMDHITWFISFAPVDQPRYAITVMVVSGRSGGHTCAPLARKVYETLLEIERRQLSGTSPLREREG